MSSKRAVRRRACERKRLYASYLDAKRALDVLLGRGAEHLHVYPCGRHWHVGHLPGHIQRLKRLGEIGG